MTVGSKIDWKHTANIYEVNLRQYTEEGSFNAFKKELPRLKDMGVQVLWLMPITPIAKERRKGSMGSYYACSDYVSINPEFGSLADFKSLVHTAQEMGFKLIIDWVANHTGWDHVWTKSHPNYYLHDANTGTFQTASGMDDIIELNYENPDLREAMISAMQFWVQECNIDGFRCDLASWVTLSFWEQARPRLDAVKPLFWLGEFDELENPGYGKVFDASYSWKWMHKTKDFYQYRQPLQELKNLLMQYEALGTGSMRAWFTSNHDENSWNGTEYEKYGAIARALAVFSCTWNGIPLLYSGQEMPLLHQRLQFFDKDPIPWNGKYELHGFYKKLLALKNSHQALRGGDEKSVTSLLATSASHQVLAFHRKNGEEEVIVMLNFSDEATQFELENHSASGLFEELFSGCLNNFSQSAAFRMQAGGYLVFVKRSIG